MVRYRREGERKGDGALVWCGASPELCIHIAIRQIRRESDSCKKVSARKKSDDKDVM